MLWNWIVILAIPQQKNLGQVAQRWTVEKWIAEDDKTMNTMLWLKFEKCGCDHDVSKLMCSICQEFKEKLQSVRNY